jgi:hypothetical protein
MRSALLITSVLCALALLPDYAVAQVTVVREGDENPMLTVAKSTFWGAVTGLLIGGAIAVAVDENKSDQVKWGFVIGTIGGCAFGFYHVMTREPPTSALLNVERDAVAWAVPSLEFDLAPPGETRARLSLLAFSF